MSQSFQGMRPTAASIAGALLLAALAPIASAAPGARPCRIEGWPAQCRYAPGQTSAAYWMLYFDNPSRPDAPTVVTGTPELLKIQKDYNARADPDALGNAALRTLCGQTCAAWNARQGLIDDPADPPVPQHYQGSRPVNPTSPFVPRNARRCDSWSLEFSTFDKLFEPWRIQSLELVGFPTRVTGHGQLNLQTIRTPLYTASVTLISRWTAFWQDCWAATPEGEAFDGCQTDFASYVGAGGAADSLASSLSYPSDALALRARAIAQAVDAAQRFHEATLALLPLTRRWTGTGVETGHLEPDDVPADVSARVQAAEKDLTAALARVDLAALEP